MPRTCTICRHADRALIDKALLENTPYRHIASQYGTSTTALQRHRAKDLPGTLLQAKEAQVVANGNDLLAQMQDLTVRTMRIYTNAEKSGDPKIALKAIGEMRRNLELFARLMGELESRKPLQVTTNFNVEMTNQMAPVPGLILAFIARREHLPTDEEQQQLLAAGGGYQGRRTLGKRVKTLARACADSANISRRMQTRIKPTSPRAGETNPPCR
jgi:hypothetical protein